MKIFSASLIVFFISQSASAGVLDCRVSGNFGQPDRHLVANTEAKLTLDTKGGVLIEASTLGSAVLIQLRQGSMRISSTGEKKANLRFEWGGEISEYFCEIK